MLCLAAGCARAASTNAWERTDAYVAPNFEAFFPDDPVASARLDDLERTGGLDRLTPEEATSAIQNGLRRSTRAKLSILRTFGNRFIWGRTPQNPAAIELMYHAAGAPDLPESDITSYWAVYFGLSVAEHKTPNILRTLAEICMRSERADMFSRIQWGVRDQQADCLAYLKPFLDSPDQSVRAKAQLVQRFLKQELNPFVWATEEARKRAEVAYRDQLPAIKQALSEGSSKERSSVLEKILKDRVHLIMDDSFIPAFAACSRDVDRRVRVSATILIGDRWIWSVETQKQNDAAIDLMLQLSYDPDPKVRYDAVYYGLSTVHDKSDAVIHRLVDMFFKDRDNSDICGRIGWGLMFGQRSMPDNVLRVAAQYMSDPDPKVANLAAQWYQAQVQSSSKDLKTEPPAALGTNAVGEIRNRLQVNFRPFLVRLTDGQALLIRNRDNLALGDQVVVLLEPEDHIRTIPARQIAALEDLPSAAPTK